MHITVSDDLGSYPGRRLSECGRELPRERDHWRPHCFSILLVGVTMYLKKRLALLLDLIDGQFRASIANDLSVRRVELVPEQCPED